MKVHIMQTHSHATCWLLQELHSLKHTNTEYD